VLFDGVVNRFGLVFYIFVGIQAYSRHYIGVPMVIMLLACLEEK
jgi:hypothetical protein